MDHTDCTTLVLFLNARPQIQIIKCSWVSCSGSIYAELLTRSRCLTLAIKNLALHPNTSCLAGLIPSHVLSHSILSPTGRLKVFPDWKSLYQSSPTEAVVQCFVHEDFLHQRTLEHPAERCPRSCLERIISTARETRSLEFLVGFELEFYLLEPTSSGNGRLSDDSLPPDEHLIPWRSSQRLHGKRSECLRKCMLALEEAGIIVEHGHAEGSVYQFEIATGPLEPLVAVDAFYASRDIIKRTAMTCHLIATFVPKPFPDSEPSGLHLHLSVHQASLLKSPDLNITNMFLAGILSRLPALCAISMPSSQSYLRGTNKHTAGEFVAWGRANQSVPLNEVTQGYWEIRSMDCTANVYLAVASYIGAGMMGIQRAEQLPSQDPGTVVEALAAEDRFSLGITRYLPKSLEEALSEFENHLSDMQQILGRRLVDLFQEVKKNEIKTREKWNDEMLRELYMFHF